MLHPVKTIAVLCSILVSVGCLAEEGPADIDRGLQVEPNDFELVAAPEPEPEPGAPAHGPSDYAAAEASCQPVVEVNEGPDWLTDMTADELTNAPDGYLMMAPIEANDEEGCSAEGVVTVRVAEGVSPDAKIASLCADEISGSSDLMLRTCADREASIGELGMSSLTTRAEPLGGGCYFCTSGTCLNNGAYTQRKEGSTNPCFPNFWDTCCWAINGGCCY